MSFTFNTTSHDTRLYDPERHDNQIVAVFEDDAAAGRARDALIAAGVPQGAIRLVAAPRSQPAAASTAGDQIMDAFMSLFSASHEQRDYAHAVERGHAMLIVAPTPDTDRRKMIEVLEHSEAIDFDAKLEEWRQAGYEGMGDRPADGSGESMGRVGRREALEGGSRVRSYISDRPAAEPAGQADTLGTGGTVTNATPGAQSSGTNAPRSE